MDDVQKTIKADNFSSGPIDLSREDIQLQYILKYIPDNKKAIILDAGCGNGGYALYLSKLGYCNVFTIDLFDESPLNTGIYLNGSIDALPYKDNLFDFIYCNSVIYYLNDCEKVIQEFSRVMKSSSIIFITAHTKYSLYTFWRKLKMYLHLKTESVKHLAGTKFNTAHFYEKLLKANGCEIMIIDGWSLPKNYSKLLNKFSKLLKKYCQFIYELGTFAKCVSYLRSVFSYHSMILAKKVK